MCSVVVLSFRTGSFWTYLGQSVLVHEHAYKCSARVDVQYVLVIRRYHFLTVSGFRTNQVCCR